MGEVGKGASGCMQSQPQPPRLQQVTRLAMGAQFLTSVLAPSSDCLKRKYSLLSSSVLATKRVIFSPYQPVLHFCVESKPVACSSIQC